MQRVLWQAVSGLSSQLGRHQADRLVFVAVAISCILMTSGCRDQSKTTVPDSKKPSGRRLVFNAEKPVSSGLAFEEMIEQSGIQIQYDDGRAGQVYSIVESVGGGLGIFDYDLDGQLDLIYPGGGSFDKSNRQSRGRNGALYRGLGTWKFIDKTDAACIDMSSHYNHAIASADYNSDGFQDVLVTGFSGLMLFANQGDGTFQEVALKSGLAGGQSAASALWADFDGDSHLDLYVTTYTNWSFENDPPCVYPKGDRDLCGPREFGGANDFLYRSNGDATFSEVTQSFGIREGGRGLGVLAADWNEDRKIDLLVANDEEPNFFYANEGGKGFREIGTRSGIALDESGSPDGNMGVALGDYNRDGRFDVFVTHYETETSALYRNTGRMNFTHASRLANITCFGNMFVSWGTAFVDFDLDADEDLVLVNGHVLRTSGMAPLDQLPILLENREAKSYVDASKSAGTFFGQPRSARGLAVGDFDRDGQPDLATSNVLQPHSLLRNRSTRQGKWIGFRLIGTQSNRDAIGATLVAKAGDWILARQVYGGGSYASTSDRVLYIGLGDREVDSVEIRWPSGQDSKLSNMVAGKVHTVIEPSDAGNR